MEPEKKSYKKLILSVIIFIIIIIVTVYFMQTKKKIANDIDVEAQALGAIPTELSSPVIVTNPNPTDTQVEVRGALKGAALTMSETKMGSIWVIKATSTNDAGSGGGALKFRNNVTKTDVMRIMPDEKIQITTLSGTQNGFGCINSQGIFFRSTLPCNQ